MRSSSSFPGHVHWSATQRRGDHDEDAFWWAAGAYETKHGAASKLQAVKASQLQVRSAQEPVPAAAAGGAMSSWNLPAETRAPQATL